MNQLATTNNNFTLETSIMEKILDASGYNFHVLTIDGHKYWIAKEIVRAFGFEKKQGSMNMFRKIMDRKDIHTIRLDKDNGMRELKIVLYEAVRGLNTRTETHWTETSIRRTPYLALVREDTLQKYLTLYTRKPDAKEIGKKLYKYFTKPVKKVKKPENALQKLLRSEVEALQLGSEFRQWYLDKVEQSPYLKRMNYKRRSPNWLLCLMGFYNSLSSRFVVALGKNSAKKRLKSQGASSRMLNSNRAIIRSQHPPSGDYWTLIVSEYMRHVDNIIEHMVNSGATKVESINYIFNNSKAVLDEIVNDVGTLKVFDAINVLHQRGYADENEREFRDNFLTEKDRKGLHDGTLSIDMKPDLGVKLLQKSVDELKLLEMDRKIDKEKRK